MLEPYLRLSEENVKSEKFFINRVNGTFPILIVLFRRIHRAKPSHSRQVPNQAFSFPIYMPECATAQSKT